LSFSSVIVKIDLKGSMFPVLLRAPGQNAVAVRNYLTIPQLYARMASILCNIEPMRGTLHRPGPTKGQIKGETMPRVAEKKQRLPMSMA